jgi:hypothetical protein
LTGEEALTHRRAGQGEYGHGCAGMGLIALGFTRSSGLALLGRRSDHLAGW